MPAFDRILVPTDLSDFASLAVKYGAHFSRSLQSTLALLYVEDLSMSLSPSPSRFRAGQAMIGHGGDADQQEQQQADPDSQSGSDFQIVPGAHENFPSCMILYARVGVDGMVEGLRQDYSNMQ